MTTHRTRAAATLLAATCLAGCSSLGGPYTPSRKASAIASMSDDAALSVPVAAVTLLPPAAREALGRGTLAWFVAGTLSDNPVVRGAYYGLASGGLGVANAEALRGPTLGLGASYGGGDNGGQSPVSQVYNLGLNGNLVIWDGGLGAIKSDRARWQALAALANVADKVESVGYGVVQAYVQVLQARDAVEISGRHIARHVEMLKMVRQLADQGVENFSDVPEASARLEISRQERVEAQRTLANAEASFQRLTGARPPAALPAPPRAPADGDVESLVAEALRVHPAIRASDADIQAAIKSVLAIDAERMGSLSIQLGTAGLISQFPGVLHPYTLGTALVRLTLPLFTNGERDSRLRKAAADLEVAVSQRADIERAVALGVRQASADRAAASEAAALVLREKRDDAEVARIRRSEYFLAAVVDLKTALDAEQALMQAEIKESNARWSHALSSYKVVAAQGRLADYLHVVGHRDVLVSGSLDPFPMPTLLDAPAPASPPAGARPAPAP